MENIINALFEIICMHGDHLLGFMLVYSSKQGNVKKMTMTGAIEGRSKAKVSKSCLLYSLEIVHHFRLK